ncbi:methylated-DNA--[protein]-cysteine S-methyltransferase, partial [Sandarakinorhabdus oryzae]|uniref:methylated-DNA--[protein]-cysteine S-methyltransferase n=1 Tax=Sandarakinorhabdus oryzae TaxID=2675220 RepID=UPI0012E168CB
AVASALPGGAAARLASRAEPGQPPPAIARAITAIQALLAGDRVDLGFIACEPHADPFAEQVRTLTRAIPPGQTRTYGDLATDLGDKALARAVGTTLGRNPLPLIVPCHRVLGADGKLTGFSAPGGVKTKLKLLEIEGAFRSDGLFGALPLALKPGRGG